ncbi:MAG: CDP-alcohol phosphatidyltransferase family protein [Candidatus Nanopelagicales bacterium]
MTAGEEWIRLELERLRARRFAPRAIVGFLGASQARAADVRRARPDLARRARTWELAGAAGWTGLALAGHEPFRRRAAPGLAWWATTCVMLEWHLGMVETPDGTPRNLGPADALTLARAWLVPAIADDLSPVLVTAAGLTDWLDGIAARASAPTRAGRDLEGLVDAAVLAAALRSARRAQLVHPAVVSLELARITAGMAYAVAVYFACAQPPSEAVLRAGRTTTPLRVGGLVAAASGHRRTAHALLATGSVASLGLLARTVVRR